MGFVTLRDLDGNYFTIHANVLPRMEENVSLDRVQSESDERTVNNDVRHQYRILSEPEKAAMVRIKDLGLDFITAIDACVPHGRERSLAKTRIEEAVMWAVKGLTQ